MGFILTPSAPAGEKIVDQAENDDENENIGQAKDRHDAKKRQKPEDKKNGSDDPEGAGQDANNPNQEEENEQVIETDRDAEERKEDNVSHGKSGKMDVAQKPESD